MPALDINYEAPPTLGYFLGSNAFVRCAVGPLGSGKSSACVVELLRRAAQQAPGPDGIRRTRFAVVRNTYRELEDTTRHTFEQWIPDALGKWSEQDFTFTMRFADVESEVLFRALDKPKDVKKLLSLELTGCYFNELREIAKSVFDGAQGRVGRFPSKAQGGPTWCGVWADTNPWNTGHWAAKLFGSSPEGFELFRQPGGRTPLAENVANLPAGYYSRLCLGKESDWIRVYVDGLEAASDIGAIFGDLLGLLAERGGLRAFQYRELGQPVKNVFTSWDLGRTDATAIWAFVVLPEVRFLRFYQAHGKPLSHYFAILDEWAKEDGFEYEKHWLPHDARARTLVSQTSILDQCITRWGPNKVAIVPSLSILDGIQAARELLEQPGTLFHPQCEEGVDALREYRYAWDDDSRSYSKKPLHNWASHPADAFRGAAVVTKVSDLLMPKPPPKPPPVTIRAPNSFTLDELWEMEDDRKAGRL